MKYLINCYAKITSSQNIWLAQLKYRRGKRDRQAVRVFEANLEEELLNIFYDLLDGSYQHGNYSQFIVYDPKKRIISVAPLRDRIVHQAVYNILYPFYEKSFSPFSFSCREKKGTHKAIKFLSCFLRRASLNGNRECYILHGDIKKCFDSISQEILMDILKEKFCCPKTIDLLSKIIKSYTPGGLPLGNLTSQLFINIYLDKLDKFVKEKLKIKYYLRYADDFLAVSQSKTDCLNCAKKIREFLAEELKLDFPLDHQKIVSAKNGVEVLGYKFFADYFKIRPKTYRRARALFRKRFLYYDREEIGSYALNNSYQSVKGLLKWGRNYQLLKKINLN